MGDAAHHHGRGTADAGAARRNGEATGDGDRLGDVEVRGPLDAVVPGELETRADRDVVLVERNPGDVEVAAPVPLSFRLPDLIT